MARITYFTDMEKSVVTANFIKRGWTAASTDEEWNFYWFVIYSKNKVGAQNNPAHYLSQGQHSNLSQLIFCREYLPFG